MGAHSDLMATLRRLRGGRAGFVPQLHVEAALRELGHRPNLVRAVIVHAQVTRAIRWRRTKDGQEWLAPAAREQPDARQLKMPW